MIDKMKNWPMRVVGAELPFFILMTLLIDYRAIYWFVKYPTGWLDDWHQYPLLRFLSISSVYSFILTCIVYYTKKELLKYLFYFVIVLLLCVDVFLFICAHTLISPNSLLFLSETNLREINDFIQTYLFSLSGVFALLLFAGLIFVCVIAEKYRVEVSRYFSNISNRKRYLISWILCFALLGGLFSFRYFVELFRCDSLEEADRWSYHSMQNADQISNLLFCVYDLKLAGEVLSKAECQTKLVQQSCPQLLWKKDTIDVILIIGESYSRYHSSIYGYPLKTNPYLACELQEGRLFAFSDVVSPYADTSESVRNTLSINSIGDNEKWYDLPFFPAIFREAGYRVLFWDNQYDISSVAPYDFTLNAYLHGEMIATISYDVQRPYISMYDADLVADYQHYRSEHQISNPTFTIFHLQGQHFSTEERYPQIPEFQHFTVDSIHRSESWMTNGKKQVIVHYDNCTLYNDFVLDQIISIFRDRCSVLVYLSDHGEDIYDTGNNLGRRSDSLPSYEIPFFIWCSDKYKEKHGDIVDYIQESVNKPLMTDNLGHLLLRLGGVMSKYYNEVRDVLSPSYQCPPRIIGGNQNYDLLKRQKKEG